MKNHITRIPSIISENNFFLFQVEGLNARLDKFMSAQNSLQNEMLQQGEITFKGIVQNTAGLSSLLTAEQEASQDYKKVSIFDIQTSINRNVSFIKLLQYSHKLIL